jgi:chromosome segregation ATPase
MSEERFDRIEAQIAAMGETMQQGMNAIRQDMTIMQQDMNAMQQNINAVREDVTSLRQRMDSIEGTTIVAIRDGFDSLRTYLDDLNYDLADNERKTRRLARRVSRLERRDE